MEIKRTPLFCVNVGHVEKLLDIVYKQSGKTRKPNLENILWQQITQEDLDILGIKRSLKEILQGHFFDEKHLIDEDHTGKLEYYKFATALSWKTASSSQIEEILPKILCGAPSLKTKEKVSPALDNKIRYKRIEGKSTLASIPPIEITLSSELFKKYSIPPKILEQVYGANEINLQIQVLQLLEEHCNILRFLIT